MKNLRQFCAIAVLILALALPAFAGEIPCPGVAQQQSSVMGDIGSPGVSATGETSTPELTALDPVTEAALSLLQSILSIF